MCFVHYHTEASVLLTLRFEFHFRLHALRGLHLTPLSAHRKLFHVLCAWENCFSGFMSQLQRRKCEQFSFNTQCLL